MQSMTGYGRARACRDGREITIELKTVNHRFLDLSFRMPKNLTFLEDVLPERINKSALKRGHVDVFVTYANTRADAREVRVDGLMLEAFGQALKGAEEALDPYRRMTAAEAEAALTELGLYLRPTGVTDYSDTTIATGQSIDPGSMVDPGTVVEVQFMDTAVQDYAANGNISDIR